MNQYIVLGKRKKEALYQRGHYEYFLIERLHPDGGDIGYVSGEKRRHFLCPDFVNASGGIDGGRIPDIALTAHIEETLSK